MKTAVKVYSIADNGVSDLIISLTMKKQALLNKPLDLKDHHELRRRLNLRLDGEYVVIYDDQATTVRKLVDNAARKA